MFVLDTRTATNHFPGIGRYVVSLAHGLTKLVGPGELTLLTSPTSAAQSRLPEILCRSNPASPFSIQQQWTIPAQLRQTHAMLYHSPYYLMPYAPRVPTVLTVYDVIPLLYPHYYSPIQRLIYRAAHLLALRAAQAVLAISEATKRDFIRLFRVAPEKIAVTPLAASPHFAPRPTAEVEALRRQLGLPENYVLYFGSNKPHKNLARLVDAFGQLTARYSQVTLVIAGHWDKRYPEAKQKVEANNWAERIKFIGAVSEENLPALYSGALLFIFPSEYEGFGLPVLEAMACGTPVVCASTSSLPEVVGETGWLFDPMSVDNLRDTIATALADKIGRAEKHLQGLNYAAHFTWARTAEQTLTIYRTLQS